MMLTVRMIGVHNSAIRTFAQRHTRVIHGRHSRFLRAATSLPGNYSFITNVDSLRRLLRRTDLPSACFRSVMGFGPVARCGVVEPLC